MNSLRILAWNAARNFQKGKDEILALSPDVLIVSECRRRDLDGLVPSTKVVWREGSDRGVVIVALTDATVREGPKVGAKLIATAILEFPRFAINVVGVCAQKGARSYAESTLSAAEELTAWMEERLTFWGGDFNQSQRFRRAVGHNFQDTHRALEERGLESCYHAISGESFGAETRATYFRYKRSDSGFHIDYIYAPVGAARKCDIGSFISWVQTGISDHVPIVADFEIGAGEVSG